MISVLALDRSDGWVFAKDGESILFLRPPYRLAEARVVSEAVVERAVTQHGYAACDEELPSWADVVAFVRREVARQRADEGRSLPDEGVGRELLRVATVSVVERFLERIRDDLLPRDELHAAEKLIHALQMESPRLQQSPDLSFRAAELLDKVLKRRAERIQKTIDKTGRFERLDRRGRLAKVEDYGRQVARAGSMFVRNNAP